ncbi:CAP domain-containing protein [Croceiramulus getboli]|nr:CAP domain-containing protein [Flavobacteriaceae bacterium YJPT1-3]
MTNLSKFIVLLCSLVVLSSCSKDDEVLNDTSQELVAEINLKNDTAFMLEVMDEVNAYRQSVGLSSLKLCTKGESKAVEHSYYMVEDGTISHDRFFERSDYLKARGAKRVSENVAFGYRSAKSVVEAWINSPSHKEAMEGDFSHTGIGVTYNEHGVPFYTQLFVKY